MKKQLTKIVCLIVILLSISVQSFSQAKKPTIMVVPARDWCTKNQFMVQYDNQGSTFSEPDYRKALDERSDLKLVIIKLGEMMTERNFPLKNLESELTKLQKKAAKQSVSNTKTNPLKELSKTAKADIWMEIGWDIIQNGPKKSVNFRLQGLDAYTGKQIAAAAGTGQPSFNADVTTLLEEAVLAHIDNFNSQLQQHFDDLFENGREVTLEILTDENFANNLETEYGGMALSRQIKKWIKENTVKGRFSQLEADEDGMEFEQVRIPLYGTDGEAFDTQTWAEGLQDYLKTLGVETSVKMEGLGNASVILKK